MSGRLLSYSVSYTVKNVTVSQRPLVSYKTKLSLLFSDLLNYSQDVSKFELAISLVTLAVFGDVKVSYLFLKKVAAQDRRIMIKKAAVYWFLIRRLMEVKNKV